MQNLRQMGAAFVLYMAVLTAARLGVFHFVWFVNPHVLVDHETRDLRTAFPGEADAHLHHPSSVSGSLSAHHSRSKTNGTARSGVGGARRGTRTSPHGHSSRRTLHPPTSRGTRTGAGLEVLDAAEPCPPAEAVPARGLESVLASALQSDGQPPANCTPQSAAITTSTTTTTMTMTTTTATDAEAALADFVADELEVATAVTAAPTAAEEELEPYDDELQATQVNDRLSNVTEGAEAPGLPEEEEVEEEELQVPSEQVSPAGDAETSTAEDALASALRAEFEVDSMVGMGGGLSTEDVVSVTDAALEPDGTPGYFHNMLAAVRMRLNGLKETSLHTIQDVVATSTSLATLGLGMGASNGTGGGKGGGAGEGESERIQRERVQRRRIELLRESSPAVQAILAKRPEHPGPWMQLTWPVTEAKPPIHVHLNYKQFVEDGALSDGSRSRIPRAYVSYLAQGKDGRIMNQYIFHRNALPYLPKDDVNWQFKRCAIVSNSGSLLSSNYGPEIDANDAVFRINYPPLEGYAEYVGTKTTFDFSNHANAQELIQPNSPKFIPATAKTFRSNMGMQKNSSTVVLFESSNAGGWRLFFLPQILKRFPHQVAILSPDFMVAAEESWRNISAEVASKGEACSAMKRRIERAAAQAEEAMSSTVSGKGAIKSLSNTAAALRSGLDTQCKPTSGWYVLALALQVCDEVNMYGFSAWHKQRKGMKQAPYHYFDKVQGVTNVHSFDLSLRIYQRLAQVYPIHLY